MASSLDIRDVQVLKDLENALGRFASGVATQLQAVDAEIAETQSWLQKRVGVWQREVERAERDLARAVSALSHCRNSLGQERDSRVQRPDCSAEAAAVARAAAHLDSCRENLHTAQQWRSRVEQACVPYRADASRLRYLASGGHTDKARATLVRLEDRYRSVHVRTTISSNFATPSVDSSTEAPATSVKRGVTTAEKEAIRKRWNAGESITVEELEKLVIPACDLRAETLDTRLEERVKIEEMMRSRQFYEMTRGLWTAQAPGLDLYAWVQTLAGIVLDTAEIMRFWQGKD